jgi:hypothetical protein
MDTTDRIKKIVIVLEALGVSDVQRALRELAKNTNILSDSNEDLTKTYGGVGKAISSVTKGYVKSNKVAVSGGGKQLSIVNKLIGRYSYLGKQVGDVGNVLKTLVIPSSFKDAIKYSSDLSNTFLVSSVRASTLGIGIGELETGIRELGDQTNLTTKDVIKMWNNFASGMKIVKLTDFKAMTKNLAEIFGPSNIEAINKYSGAIQSISNVSLGLGEQLMNIGKQSKGSKQVMVASLRAMASDGVIELERLREAMDIMGGGKQYTQEGEEKLKAAKARSDALATLRTRVEDVALAFGDKLLPIAIELQKVLTPMFDMVGKSIEWASSKLKGFGVDADGVAKSLLVIGGIGIGSKIFKGLGGGKLLGGGLNLLRGKTGTGSRVYVTNWPLSINKPRVPGKMGKFGNFLIGGAATPGLSKLGRVGKFAKSPAAIAAQLLGSYGLGKAQTALEKRGHTKTAAAAGLGKTALGIGAAASTGAMLGSMVGPIGTVIGGVIGAAIGTLKAKDSIGVAIKKLFGKGKTKPKEGVEIDKKEEDKIKDKLKASEKLTDEQKKQLELDREYNKSVKEGIDLQIKTMELIDKGNKLYEARKGLLAAIAYGMKVTGEGNLSDLKDQYEATKNNLINVSKLRMQLADQIGTALDKAIEKQKKSGKELSEEEKKSYFSLENVLGKENFEVINKKLSEANLDFLDGRIQARAHVMKLEEQATTGFTKDIEGLQKAYISFYDEKARAASLEVSRMETVASLAKNFVIGVGASAKLQMQIVEAIDKEIFVLKEQAKIRKEFIADGQQIAKNTNELYEIENKILTLTVKKGQASKSLREGWMSAIKAANVGTSAFTRIAFTQAKNAGLALDLIGEADRVITSVSGYRVGPKDEFPIQKRGIRHTEFGGLAGSERLGMAPYPLWTEKEGKGLFNFWALGGSMKTKTEYLTTALVQLTEAVLESIDAGGGSLLSSTLPVRMGSGEAERIERARREDNKNIPGKAFGGTVPATSGGKIIRVAEGGQTEAIVPMPDGKRVPVSLGLDGKSATVSLPGGRSIPADVSSSISSDKIEGFARGGVVDGRRRKSIKNKARREKTREDVKNILAKERYDASLEPGGSRYGVNVSYEEALAERKKNFERLRGSRLERKKNWESKGIDKWYDAKERRLEKFKERKKLREEGYKEKQEARKIDRERQAAEKEANYKLLEKDVSIPSRVEGIGREIAPYPSKGEGVGRRVVNRIDFKGSINRTKMRREEERAVKEKNAIDVQTLKDNELQSRQNYIDWKKKKFFAERNKKISGRHEEIGLYEKMDYERNLEEDVEHFSKSIYRPIRRGQRERKEELGLWKGRKEKKDVQPHKFLIDDWEKQQQQKQVQYLEPKWFSEKQEFRKKELDERWGFRFGRGFTYERWKKGPGKYYSSLKEFEEIYKDDNIRLLEDARKSIDDQNINDFYETRKAARDLYFNPLRRYADPLWDPRSTERSGLTTKQWRKVEEVEGLKMNKHEEYIKIKEMAMDLGIKGTMLPAALQEEVVRRLKLGYKPISKESPGFEKIEIIKGLGWWEDYKEIKEIAEGLGINTKRYRFKANIKKDVLEKLIGGARSSDKLSFEGIERIENLSSWKDSKEIRALATSLGVFSTSDTKSDLQDSVVKELIKRSRKQSVLGFANGGIATASPGGQMAMVGEGGKSEAIVPLPDGRSIPVDLNSNKGGGTTTVNADVSLKGASFTVVVKDAKNFGNQVAKEVDKQMQSHIVTAFEQLSI